MKSATGFHTVFRNRPMESVEQVILCVRTIGHRRAVEIAGATELVRTTDLTELIGWFGQDDTEALLRFDTSNLFFHPLPSGDFALGLIFSAQNGLFSFFQPPRSFFVRILVIPPHTLLHYANNPISLYRDLDQRRKVPLFRRSPRRVHPLTVSRRSPVFDRQAVLGLSQRFGAATVARLVQMSSVSLCTFFASSMHSRDLLGALLNLFPVRFRPELTFATELFFSARTPLRLIGTSGEWRLAEQADGLGVPLVLLKDVETTPLRQRDNRPFSGDAWSRLVHFVLRTGNYDFFESRLKSEAARNSATSWNGESMGGDFSELQEMGKIWLQELCQETLPTQRRTNALPGNDNELEAAIGSVLRYPSGGSAISLAERSAVKKESVVSPRATIVRQPRQQELLAQIDSDVTRLLFGDSTRLPALQTAWQELRQLLPWNEKEQLREEFVSLIHSVLVGKRDSFPARLPHRSVELLDVLLVFLGE